MALVAILIVIGVAALAFPLLFLFSNRKEDVGDKKQMLAALDSAIGTDTKKAPVTVNNFRKNELVSAIPWVNHKLEQLQLASRLSRILNQADLSWSPGKLIAMVACCFAIPAFALSLRISSLLLSVLVGLVLSFAPLAYVFLKRKKRFGKFERGLPEALDLMVSALRVGHSFNSAVGLVSRECPDPVGTEFRVAFEEQNFGLELRTALEHLTSRVPLQDLKIAVTAILIQRESGGNLAEVLEKTAYVIRQRFRLKKQVMVHTAQGRLTGWILTILPIVLGIILYFVNPDTMSVLWTDELGKKLLWLGGISLVVGTVIIQKIVRMDV